MQTFRKILFWLHLISGVTAGIFIFIMCVTGALLSFEKNIVNFAERGMNTVSVPSENAQRLSVNELINKVIEAKPNAKPSGITFQNDQTSAATVALGRDGQVFVNPYTGEITGEGAKDVRSFFRFNTDLHRWLAIPGDGRQVGKTLNDAANVLFLLLAVTGVYIWFPRQFTRKHFAPILWFRKTNSGKARDFNWHNTIGFWTSLVLIILTLTGVIISYQWAGNLLYTLTGNELPQQQRPPNAPNQPTEQTFVLPENLENSMKTAETYGNWKSISLRLPIAKDEAVFTIDEGKYWNIFARSTLTVDAKTAQVSKFESYGEQNAARQLRSWVRFTHTGETGGFIGQLIGFIACIGGAVLVYTGIALSLRRFSAWRGRRAE
ncbi:MAG TPA: PepSY-associated TM helix domain-containing protein [Pyrinomonadaceae bacterium]|nr:PepSY-associated TM helix domain-containing protein [Pyrinomonadaceae bacterium]